MKTLHMLLIVLIAYFILSRKETFDMPLDDICNLNQDGNDCSTPEGLAKAVAYCKDKYSKQSKLSYVFFHTIFPLINGLIYLLFFFVAKIWVEKNEGLDEAD